VMDALLFIARSFIQLDNEEIRGMSVISHCTPAFAHPPNR
jgi:hypothetical protein